MDEKECAQVCGKNPNGIGTYWGCSAYVLADLPGPSFNCYTCVEGRRPQGYDEVLPDAPTPVGAWLAHAADLERVSIDAFQILAAELAHHGASEALVARTHRAARDEIRHARMLSGLARREGANVSTAPIARREVRALFDVALENAIEGCVRETYGALVAAWQANNATRKEVRRAMTRIVVDETMHAELAWDVHAWAMARLTTEDRARIEAAIANAIADLASGASTTPPPSLVSELGLPNARDAQRLVLGLGRELMPLARAA